MMGQSINEVIKSAVISMMQVDRFDTAHGSPTVSKPTMTLMPVTAEVDRFDTAGDTAHGNPPRAPSSSDIYSIKNNKISISHQGLKDAWDEFVQHRKEIKKTIQPTQMNRMWMGLEKILEKHGIDGLISCLNKSVECGWQGVFDTHLIEQQEQTKSSGGGFSMEDFE